MSQVDIVFIHPSAVHGIAGGHAVYGDLGADLVAIEPPAWCRMLAGYCRDRGYSVKIIDAEAERLSPEETATRAADALLVCIAAFGHQPSASTQQMHAAGETARAIKAQRRTQRIIMVGGHVAALPERTLREEDVDFTCSGEGPVTLVRLLEELHAGTVFDFSEVPGLVWWDVDNLVPLRNKSAPLVAADDLHGDTWDLLDLSRYQSHNWQCFGDLGQRHPYASIYTSFGCPFRCEFCCIQAPFSPEEYGNRYRMRSPEKVVAEIAMLHERYGISTFKIIDEMFVMNRRHVTAICDGLIERGLGGKLNIWAYSRIDTVKDGMLPKLRDAGFKWLALGIEAGEEYVRDGAEKHFTNADIVKVVREIEAHGIHVISNWIFGLRHDRRETMQATLDMALRLNTAFANFYANMPYPGSAQYKRALAEGWVLPAEWRGFSQHNEWTRPLDTEHVSAKEVLAFRDAAFNTYFENPAYQEMVLKKFGEDTLTHVRQMTQYRLTRKLLTGEID